MLLRVRIFFFPSSPLGALFISNREVFSDLFNPSALMSVARMASSSTALGFATDFQAPLQQWSRRFFLSSLRAAGSAPVAPSATVASTATSSHVSATFGCPLGGRALLSQRRTFSGGSLELVDRAMQSVDPRRLRRKQHVITIQRRRSAPPVGGRQSRCPHRAGGQTFDDGLEMRDLEVGFPRRAFLRRCWRRCRQSLEFVHVFLMRERERFGLAQCMCHPSDEFCIASRQGLTITLQTFAVVIYLNFSQHPPVPLDCGCSTADASCRLFFILVVTRAAAGSVSSERHSVSLSFRRPTARPTP